MALDHDAARRRFRAGDANPDAVTLRRLVRPEAVAERRAADPVAALDIDELTASMAFHARAARRLDEAVADARCADCPSLDAATNVARLAALAACGDLAAP